MNCPQHRSSREPANQAQQPNPQRIVSRQLLIQRLRGKIRRVETAARNDDGTIVSSGCVDIDRMLPAGGYNRGTLVEWLADPGSGAEFFSLLVAKHAAENGGAIVIIDPHNQFYPPAALALGVSPAQLIVLKGVKYLFWSIDQSLRCSAVAAVWGGLPEFETPQIATLWLRRFQLSAESSGCMGLFTRPLKGGGIPNPGWAEIQWHVQPLAGSSEARRVRTSLVRCRGGTASRSIDLEINAITGSVCRARGEHEQRNQLAAG